MFFRKMLILMIFCSCSINLVDAVTHADPIVGQTSKLVQSSQQSKNKVENEAQASDPQPVKEEKSKIKKFLKKYKWGIISAFGAAVAAVLYIRHRNKDQENRPRMPLPPEDDHGGDNVDITRHKNESDDALVSQRQRLNELYENERNRLTGERKREREASEKREKENKEKRENLEEREKFQLSQVFFDFKALLRKYPSKYSFQQKLGTDVQFSLNELLTIIQRRYSYSADVILWRLSDFDLLMFTAQDFRDMTPLMAHLVTLHKQFLTQEAAKEKEREAKVLEEFRRQREEEDRWATDTAEATRQSEEAAAKAKLEKDKIESTLPQERAKMSYDDYILADYQEYILRAPGEGNLSYENWLARVGFDGKIPVRKPNTVDKINAVKYKENTAKDTTTPWLLFRGSQHGIAPITQLQRWVPGYTHPYSILKHIWPKTEAEWLDEAKVSAVIAYFNLPIALSVSFGSLTPTNKKEVATIVKRFVDWVEHIIGANDSESIDCSTCLEPFMGDEPLCYLSTCKHVFHTKCVKDWLKQKNEDLNAASAACQLCNTQFGVKNLQNLKIDWNK